jgi:hypothetical protein
LSNRPFVRNFLEGQKRLRAELLATMGREPDRYSPEALEESCLWLNFRYMEVFDQFAQFVCNRYPLNSQNRQNGPTPTLSDLDVPVAPGVPDTRLTIHVTDERTAIVRPYPFRIDPLIIRFEGRLVADKSYASRDEFASELFRAERLPVEYALTAE